MADFAKWVARTAAACALTMVIVPTVQAAPSCTATLSPSPDAACVGEFSKTGQPNEADIEAGVGMPLDFIVKYENAEDDLVFDLENGSDVFSFTGDAGQPSNDIKTGSWSTTLTDTSDVFVTLKWATMYAIFDLNGETSGTWSTPKGLSNVQVFGKPGGGDIPLPATLLFFGLGLVSLGSLMGSRGRN